MVPGGDIGELPLQMSMSEPLDFAAVTTGNRNRGTQERIYIGNRDQFHMHGVLSYQIQADASTNSTGLPTDAVVTSTTLRLFAVSYENYNPSVPLDVDVYMLDKEFIEEEVTWDQAADGDPWLVPGAADGGSTLMGSFQFTGEALDSVAIDTLIVVLDSLLMDQFVRSGEKTLSLALVPSDQDAWFSMTAREIDPDSPISAEIDLVYHIEGSTTNSALDRRAKGDATITGFTGSVNPDMMTVGEIPSGQAFFQYDLSSLPANATINRALLHVKVFDAAYVDTFQVVVFTADSKEFVDQVLTTSSVSQGVGADTDSLALDVTLGVQRVLAVDSLGTSHYFVLGSQNAVNVGGFVQFYPPDWQDASMRPLLELIYTDAPANAIP